MLKPCTDDLAAKRTALYEATKHREDALYGPALTWQRVAGVLKQGGYRQLAKSDARSWLSHDGFRATKHYMYDRFSKEAHEVVVTVYVQRGVYAAGGFDTATHAERLRAYKEAVAAALRTYGFRVFDDGADRLIVRESHAARGPRAA